MSGSSTAIAVSYCNLNCVTHITCINNIQESLKIKHILLHRHGKRVAIVCPFDNLLFIGFNLDIFMKNSLYIVQILRNKFEGSSARFRNSVLQPLPFWIGSLITGIIAVVYAKLFALGESFTFYIFHLHAWLLFIVTPVCFAASWWVVKR